jgi:hypothetical protein
MSIARSSLTISEEALWNYEMQVVARASRLRASTRVNSSTLFPTSS